MSRSTKVSDDLLPLCAACRQVRDEAGWWHAVEDIDRDPDIGYTHTICPTCARRIYPELYDKMYDEEEDMPAHPEADNYLYEREHSA